MAETFYVSTWDARKGDYEILGSLDYLVRHCLKETHTRVRSQEVQTSRN